MSVSEVPSFVRWNNQTAAEGDNSKDFEEILGHHCKLIKYRNGCYFACVTELNSLLGSKGANIPQFEIINPDTIDFESDEKTGQTWININSEIDNIRHDETMEILGKLMDCHISENNEGKKIDDSVASISSLLQNAPQRTIQDFSCKKTTTEKDVEVVSPEKNDEYNSSNKSVVSFSLSQRSLCAINPHLQQCFGITNKKGNLQCKRLILANDKNEFGGRRFCASHRNQGPTFQYCLDNFISHDDTKPFWWILHIKKEVCLYY